MKLLYTNENRLAVYNARNIVANAGIAVQLRNEYAAGGVGELAPIEAWVQLWVVNDGDFHRALELLSRQTQGEGRDWLCPACNEINAASFEVCWKCDSEVRERKAMPPNATQAR